MPGSFVMCVCVGVCVLKGKYKGMLLKYLREGHSTSFAECIRECDAQSVSRIQTMLDQW